MGVRYPGPVSRHNLVCPFVVMVPCPRLGPFMFSMMVVVDAFGRHGANQDLA